jgi:protein-tyrosine phosphatase
MPSEAVVTLPTVGIHNFRDYGGYALRRGGRLAAGRLFRSGEHAHATDSDLELVDSLGITAVFDLRGTAERSKAACRRSPKFSAEVFTADGETAQVALHADAASAVDGAAARATMCRRYSEVPFRPLLVDVYQQAFRVLAESGPTSLIYCTAGKDRTGVLVALLHTAFGVHRDDIFEDYLLTNVAGNAQARIAALRDDLYKRFGDGMSEEAIRVVTSVEPAFLQSAFDAIAHRYGDIDRYLQEVMLLTPAARQHLIVSFTKQ